MKLFSDELNGKLPLAALKGMGSSISDMLNDKLWQWAKIGFAQGSKLKELGAHTNNGLRYLYISTNISKQAGVIKGDLNMSAGTEGGMTFVFKRPPNGSYIYAGVTPKSYGASIEVGSPSNVGQDWGLGLSFHGSTIPYKAQARLSMKPKYNEFLGNVAVDGIIPIKKLFMEIDGSIIAKTPASKVLRVARNMGKGDLDKISVDTKIGANGDIYLSKSLFSVLDARLKLGDASLGVKYSKYGNNPMTAFVSGRLSAGDWTVLKIYPYHPGSQP